MGKYALLIGVDTYGEGLQTLPAALKDVAALYEVLLNPQMGGFDEAKSLINPTRSDMEWEIEVWFQDRQPEDLVLLFFSGHGVKDERRDLYFAATNTKKRRDNLMRSTAISARFIHDCIKACKARYQILILDCCFSGAFGKFVGRDGGEINLEEQLGAEGRAVLASTNAVDYSFEEKGADLSIYTRYLVEGISTGAADENGDGVITVDELHRYTERRVKDASPIMSPTLIILKDEGFRIRIAQAPRNDSDLPLPENGKPTSKSDNSDKSNYRVIIVLTLDDLGKVSYAEYIELKKNKQVHIVNYSDENMSSFERGLSIRGLLLPKTTLIQNPYNPSEYAVLGKAEMFVRQWYHHFCQLCVLLGVQKISVRFNEENKRGDLQGFITFMTSLFSENIQFSQRSISTLISMDNYDPDIAKAENYLRENHLYENNSRMRMLIEQRKGENPLLRSTFDLEMSKEFEDSLRVFSSIEIELYDGFQAEIKQFKRRLRKLDMNIDLEFC
ncbi:MAG: hypothetical protein F6K42_06470 [Leptolyngbya sp. SIO1D8]|nr:hypothetical protein [Leptolyngbya sp. SIO1D8]